MTKERTKDVTAKLKNNWLHCSTVSRDQGPGMIKWLSHIIRTCIGCAMMCTRGPWLLVLYSPSPRAQFELACVFRLLFSGSKRAFNPRQRTNCWVANVTKVILFRLLKTNSKFVARNQYPFPFFSLFSSFLCLLPPFFSHVHYYLRNSIRSYQLASSIYLSTYLFMWFI
jgi:hypothetical protein